MAAGLVFLFNGEINISAKGLSIAHTSDKLSMTLAALNYLKRITLN